VQQPVPVAPQAADRCRCRRAAPVCQGWPAATGRWLR
jgi:hypothetical protein